MNKGSWVWPILKKRLEELSEQGAARDQLESAYARRAPINFGQVQCVLDSRIEDAIDQKLTQEQATDLAQAVAEH